MKNSNKLGYVLTILSSFLLGGFTASAMDVMGTGTMMKDNMKDSMSTGTMMMADDKMMMSDAMMKITKNSRRLEVAKLQQYLIDKGYLKVRKGTRLGYFGPLTMKAFKKYEDGMKTMKADTMMMKDKMDRQQMKDAMGTGTMMK